MNSTFFFNYYVLAKGFVQCKRNDPNLNECMKKSLQSAVPHLVKGNILDH